MFRSRTQAVYAWIVILANIMIQLRRPRPDIVSWLLVLNLALAAIFPHIYEKWLGSPFLKNSGIGQNAGLHELVRFGALFLLTIPMLFALAGFFKAF